jgi:hypothetical protein
MAPPGVAGKLESAAELARNDTIETHGAVVRISFVILARRSRRSAQITGIN